MYFLVAEFVYTFDWNLLFLFRLSALYCSINKQSGQIVAIKVLDLDSKEEDIDVIQREIFLLQRCDSEYITRYHASYLQGTKLCVVMDYAKGGSLRDILRSGSVGEVYINIIVRDVLNALCYLHKSGIIHRDIKAANVLLTEEGKVKLCDFGVAGQFSVNSLKRHSFVGTPFWMAPEVMKRTAYDFRADIWSLGITTFEIATGGPPHLGRDPMKVVLISDFKDIQLPDSFSANMKEFMTQCLFEDPKLRPPADELLRCKWIRNAPKGTDLLLHLVARHNEWQTSQGEASSCKTALSDDDSKPDKQADEWNFDSIQSVQNSGKSSPSNFTKLHFETSVTSPPPPPPPPGSSGTPHAGHRKGHRRNQSSIIKITDVPTRPTTPKPLPPLSASIPASEHMSAAQTFHRSFSESNTTADSPLARLFDTIPKQPSLNSDASRDSPILSEWKTSPSLPFIIDTTVLNTVSDPEPKAAAQLAAIEETPQVRKSSFFLRSRAMDSRLYKPIRLITSALKRDTYDEVLPLRPRSSTAPEFYENVDPNSFVNTVNRLSFLLNFTTRRKFILSQKPRSSLPTDTTHHPPPSVSVHSDESPLSLFKYVRSASISTFFNAPKSEPSGTLDRQANSLDQVPSVESPEASARALNAANAGSQVPASGYYNEIVNQASAPMPAHVPSEPQPLSVIQVQSLGELRCPSIVERPDIYVELESSKDDQDKLMEQQLNELCDTCWHWLDVAEQNMRRIAIMERKG